MLRLALAVVAWMVPAANAQSVSPSTPAVRPAIERIDVVPGRPLVLPIEIVDPRVLRQGTFEAVLDDGLKVVGEIHRLRGRVAERGGWLGPVVEWTSTPSREIADAAGGGWYLVCEMPAEAVGLGMWFGGERSAVNWLPDPWRLGRDATGRVPEAMWASTLPEDARASEEVHRSIEQLLANPWTRWRARLMLGCLEPDASYSDHWTPGPGYVPAPMNGVLGKVAAYQDGLWQVALARLWVGDQAEAVALRERLGRVSAFRGEWAPTFSVSQTESRELRTDLLNPFVAEKTLAIRAIAWRLVQPAAAVWVIDDAGRTDAATGTPAPTIGVLPLAESTGTTLLTIGTQLPEPVGTGAELRRVVTRTGAGGADGLRAVTVPVKVGSSASEVGVVSGVRAAAPPAVVLGPLMNDWTVGAWLAGAETEGAAAAPSAQASVRVLRSGSSADGWRVLIECREPEGDGEDEVTLWFGPRGSATAVRRVNRKGEIRGETGDEILGEVSVARGGSGWAVMLPLPAGAIEPGGLLRVGVTRTDPTGARTAWPRRMLPWDDEPGRLAIDLRAWDGY